VINETRIDEELIAEARRVVSLGDDSSQGSVGGGGGGGAAAAAEWWEAGDLCDFSGVEHDFSRRESAASVDSAVQEFYTKREGEPARYIVDFTAVRSVGVALQRSNTRKDSLVGGALLLSKDGGDGNEETQPTPLVLNVLSSHGAIEVYAWKVTEIDDDGSSDQETGGVKTTLTALNVKSKSFAFRLRPEAGKIALDQFHISALLRGKGYGLLCLGVIMAIGSEFYPTVPWVVPQPTAAGRKFYQKAGFARHLGDLVFSYKRRPLGSEDDDFDDEDEEEEEEEEGGGGARG